MLFLDCLFTTHVLIICDNFEFHVDTLDNDLIFLSIDPFDFALLFLVAARDNFNHVSTDDVPSFEWYLFRLPRELSAWKHHHGSLAYC